MPEFIASIHTSNEETDFLNNNPQFRKDMLRHLQEEFDGKIADKIAESSEQKSD